MAIPPCIKTLLPSLKIVDAGSDSIAVVNVLDIKNLLPSIEIILDGDREPIEAQFEMSLEDLRKVLRLGLSGIYVDESWYVTQVSGLRQDIQRGKFASIAEHYYVHGYIEGKLPERPIVDEGYYLISYPDVAAAIKAGRHRSAFDHFVSDGYAEGRMASAPGSNLPERRYVVVEA
jgi:hypothetical protein